MTALLFPGFLTICPARAAAAEDPKLTTVRFSGYTWEIRVVGRGGPGPNQWNPDNVRVDDQGWLHLKITHGSGGWQCAELFTKQRFGFGRYQFQVSGAIDRLDANVVLGLFNYPPPDVGTDSTNEIDIEFARWGNSRWPNGNYTVYPSVGARGTKDSHTFTFALHGDESTHRFLWTGKNVAYRSVSGLRDNDVPEIDNWNYLPAETRLIPQKPLPIHINLWLFQGKPPADGKEVEMVIRQFTFIPLDLLG